MNFDIDQLSQSTNATHKVVVGHNPGDTAEEVGFIVVGPSSDQFRAAERADNDKHRETITAALDRNSAAIDRMADAIDALAVRLERMHGETATTVSAAFVAVGKDFTEVAKQIAFLRGLLSGGNAGPK